MASKRFNVEQIVTKLPEMEKSAGRARRSRRPPKREASKAVNRFVRATGFKLVHEIPIFRHFWSQAWAMIGPDTAKAAPKQTT